VLRTNEETDCVRCPDGARVALFLASDDSSFVTRIELFVGGGRAQI
jgi:hypothetical protein